MMQPEGDPVVPRRTLFLDDVDTHDDLDTHDDVETREADHASTPPFDPEPEPTPEPAPDDDPAPSEEAEPGDEPPLTRLKLINPWLAALWLAAVVLVAAGIWGQVYLETTIYRAMGAGYVEALNAEGIAVIPAVVGSLAPWLVGIGLAAAIGATAIHSLRWYRTHTS